MKHWNETEAILARSHLGVRHIDIPITPEKVWKILNEKGMAE